MPKDLTGMRFGNIVVRGRAPGRGYQPMWYCVCDCGHAKSFYGTSLTRKNRAVKSCGCLSAGLIGKRSLIHGMTRTPTYSSWRSMWDRCANPKQKNYHQYGGRGITICKRWASFSNFFADMGVKPPRLTLERIDNDGNYSPSNCKWDTRREQANNTRRNRLLNVNGRTQTVAQWARELGRCPSLIKKRLDVGWNAAEAVLTPPLKPWGRRAQA